MHIYDHVSNCQDQRYLTQKQLFYELVYKTRVSTKCTLHSELIVANLTYKLNY